MHQLKDRSFWMRVNFVEGRTVWKISISALCVLLVCIVLCEGQINLATLRGTATDPSGAAVPLATVVVKEPATGLLIRQTSTDHAGNYEVPAIKPGVYQLTIDATGFKRYLANDILLESGQVRRQDAKLELGTVREQVEVISGAAVITTESGTVEASVNATQNDTAPLVNIYPTSYSLLTTIPGVQGGGGLYPVINGQGQAQQTQSFDGIPNDLTGEQENNSNFFSEMTAMTTNAPAESARPTQINQVTKRGTDHLHGQASYKIYSSALDAAPYTPSEAITPGVPIKAAYLQHEWDLEIGGPIMTNRTFFYGQWFAQRIPLGTVAPITSPPLAWRNGDFSSLLAGPNAVQLIDPTTGQAFQGNIIPGGRISSVAQAIQDYYPVPPRTGLANGLPSFPNVIFHFPFNSDLYKGDWLDLRVDHNLTSKNTMFVRWLERRTPYVLRYDTPTPIWTRFRRHQQWAAGDTHVFSPRLINTFRFGISFDHIKDGDPEAGQKPPDGNDILQHIGLRGSNPSDLTGQGAPFIDFNGASGIFGFGNIPGGVKNDNYIATFIDSVDWQVHRHIWKFGANFQRYKIFLGSVPDYGNVAFDGRFTGLDYADFLLGLPSESRRTRPLVNQGQHAIELGFFAQDSFKINPKLTLDYGLRWDYFGAPTSDNGLMYNFDPGTGNLIIDPSAISKVSPLYPTSTTVEQPDGTMLVVPITIVPGHVTGIPDKHSFAPRLGVAYRLSNNFVLRGGYGIYTARVTDGYGDFNSAGFANSPAFSYFGLINPALGDTGPFSVGEHYFNGHTGPSGNLAPDFQFPNPYPATTATTVPPAVSVAGYPRHIINGKIHEYNVSLERALGKNGIRVSYVGSRSRDMNYHLNINKPRPSTIPFVTGRRTYPQFVDVVMNRYDGSADYDGLQIAALRRSGSFIFNASYTYARSIANFLNTENPYNVLSHWSNDGPTMRHYASISTQWAFPVGRGHKFLGNASGLTQTLVGGWSTYTISYFGSGFWFSPAFVSGDPSNTNTFGGLPDLLGDPHNVPGGRNFGQWFNRAAFAIPQPGHFGNAKPFSLESEPLNVHHLSILKDTALSERLHFRFATMISNIFNHPYLGPPGGNIESSNGSTLSTSVAVFSSLERAAPRQITFKGTIIF
jgi:hypothetical protein